MIFFLLNINEYFSFIYKWKFCFQQHKLDAHGECDFECDKCPRVFTLKKTLERHLADAHAAGEEDKHLCDTCVIVFKSKEDLHIHIDSRLNGSAILLMF